MPSSSAARRLLPPVWARARAMCRRSACSSESGSAGRAGASASRSRARSRSGTPQVKHQRVEPRGRQRVGRARRRRPPPRGGRRRRGAAPAAARGARGPAPAPARVAGSSFKLNAPCSCRPPPPLSRVAAAGARIDGTFLVAAIEPRSFGEGKDCIVLTLSDAARPHRFRALLGRAPRPARRHRPRRRRRGRRRDPDLPRPPPARGGSHRAGRRAADPAEFLPSIGDPARAGTGSTAWRAGIRGPRLSAVLALFYDDADFRRRYGQCPASTVGHHAAIGGLAGAHL